MNTELSSKYDPSAVEAQAYKVWLDEKCFHADPAKPGEPYTIVIPPPNVTGALHLGHAMNSTLQDILIRAHRMMGFNALWIPGIDHAGIATQAVVEKQLKEQENKTRHDVGREGLVERIWKWKEQYGSRILEQLQRLGASCDWDRTRFTLDDMCAKAVRETFFKLFKDGLIYRGKRLVNWDTFLQTSISDDEIYHETVKTSLWHIRYPIEIDGSGSPDRGEDAPALLGGQVSEAEPGRPRLGTEASDSTRPSYMVVATTRPETMLGDTAVAVHSEDPRWNWAIGKHVRLPLTNRLIPIIADDILVDPKFGTGVVKVTPAHDPNDYAVWQRHKGQADEIDLINILTPDGKIASDRPEWSKYAGMKRAAARTAVVDDLKAAGLLEKEEPYETQVGHSDRSKTPVEPYLSDQWFVKMAPLAEPALEAVRSGKIKFYPERHAQQYLSWLGEKRDWPVSRQLWWGHRIPVWYHSAPDPSAIQWLRLNPDILHVGETESGAFVCLRTGDTLIEKRLHIFGFIQDPDVLDTWFSSALWPHSTLGWPEQTAELAKYYPTSVLLTGRDIITLWVARMVMMGMYNMGDSSAVAQLGRVRTADHSAAAGETVRSADPTEARKLGIPFLDVAINPTILDGKGERMSKSKGNGVDPVDIIDSYGADALRFTLTKMATETQDARMPVKRDANGKNTSEKFDEGRNFCNKLWNACRFALSNLEAVKPAEPATIPTGKPSVVGQQTDEDLMLRTQQGDEKAFAQLYERYNASVLSYLYRMLGKVEEVESIGQEVFFRAFRFAQTYQYPHKFSTWLFTITRNVAINHSRRRMQSPGRNITELNLEGIDMSGDPHQVAARATDDPEKQEELARVLKALQGLPADQKEVIAVGVFKELSDAEIAEMMSVGSAIADRGGDASRSAMADPTQAALVDRWIISRFKRTLEECEAALKAYRFDVYAKACYDFFWRDFCDWYVEIIKPAMKDPARAPQTGETLAAVLDGSLRLMHPMIPFITETIWWRLNDVRPQRGIAGKLECPPSKRLVLAAWPIVNGPADDDAETLFKKLQEVISAIRTIRNDNQVNPREIVRASLKTSTDIAQLIDANRETVELLATCKIDEIGPSVIAPVNAVTASAAGVDIFVKDLVDPNAEKHRLTKEIAAQKKQADALRGRLSNEAYVAKAPPHLIQQTRDQLAAAEAEIVKLEAALGKLGG